MGTDERNKEEINKLVEEAKDAVEALVEDVQHHIDMTEQGKAALREIGIDFDRIQFDDENEDHGNNRSNRSRENGFRRKRTGSQPRLTKAGEPDRRFKNAPGHTSTQGQVKNPETDRRLKENQ